MAEPVVATVQAALTPVVLISASAILAASIATKHFELATRVREIKEEMRANALPDARRRNLEAQLAVFYRRADYSARAHLCLYGAFLPFLLTIALLLLRAPSIVALTVLFAGVFLLGCGVVFELMELALASETLGLSVKHELPDEPAKGGTR